MRTLDRQALRDLASGAAILGTGGGGDPYLGELAALQAFETYGAPIVAQLEELPDDGLVVLAIMVGAPVPLVEKLSFGDELVTAYEAVAARLDRAPVALMSPEIGGINSILPITLAARLGLPVVDADAMGRAYPEIHQVTLTLFGLSASPFALADEHGNYVVIDGATNEWTERVARAAVMEFGAICPGVGYALPVHRLREAAILGSVSHAESIGRAIRLAHQEKTSAIDAILELTRGLRLFEGKIVDLDRQTRRGWSLGEARLDGSDDFRGQRMAIHFQNENLMATVDDEVVAMAPDLITIVEQDSGAAITTERLRYGLRVVVLGMPCDDKWRTPDGVALGGPRHFGYDLDFVAVEKLAADRAAAAGPGPRRTVREH
jgi:DUF917 family protein